MVRLTLAASLIYGVSSGIRANYGVLLGPISRSSGVSYASVSLYWPRPSSPLASCSRCPGYWQ